MLNKSIAYFYIHISDQSSSNVKKCAGHSDWWVQKTDQSEAYLASPTFLNQRIVTVRNTLVYEMLL